MTNLSLDPLRTTPDCGSRREWAYMAIGPYCGWLVARLVLGWNPDIEMAPFAPDRSAGPRSPGSGTSSAEHVFRHREQKSGPSGAEQRDHSTGDLRVGRFEAPFYTEGSPVYAKPPPSCFMGS